jgi:alpha-L-rhamnosidase
MLKKYSVLISILILSIVSSYAQVNSMAPLPNPKLLSEKWDARWVTYGNAPLKAYGIYHFRKTFELEEVAKDFVINISADNRYKLFVNGQEIAKGPARGDINHWYFETLNISSYLHNGKNVIAVKVWNLAEHMPRAQYSIETGVIIQGNSEVSKIVNTDASWKALQNTAYKPSDGPTYETGSGEAVDANLYPWNWEKLEYDDNHWEPVEVRWNGIPYGAATGYKHILFPRDIPPIHENPIRFKSVRRSGGLQIPNKLLEGKEPVCIPAHTKISILLDQGELTTAYPILVTDKGNQSKIKITYAEALYHGNRQKGNRNEIENKSIIGYCDEITCDGEERTFTTLWYRTYRYVQLEIETVNEPLYIKDISGMFTAYPFEEKAKFDANNTSLDKIWEVGWRTARLCAHETYMDCPYYEQLQYVGDTRIQALISLYVSGDPQLMKKAINMFAWSKNYEGITESRYPSHTRQYIPPFSLFWINMVHDYWMHVANSSDFVADQMRTVDDILNWYIIKLDPNTGVLGPIPHWSFLDWPKEWPWDTTKHTGGIPAGAEEGGSIYFTLQLAYTLREARDLAEGLGLKDKQHYYDRVYRELIAAVNKIGYNTSKALYVDAINSESFSQHTNIMAILAGAVEKDAIPELFDKIITDSGLIQTTFYFKFYLFKAMELAGASDAYLQMLEPWHDMINRGLTTFAERQEPTRSDCHAWSSSPVYFFLRTVCGIKPLESNFKTVLIKPHLGDLKTLNGKMPHPKGMINVNYLKTGNTLQAIIELPNQLKGIFEYEGKKIELQPGVNTIRI